jgi:hypothetical protein
MTEEAVERWLLEFGEVDVKDLNEHHQVDDVTGPFPPGYAEDLLRDEDNL